MRWRPRARHTSPSGIGRFSEPFPPHGALAAKGAENLLGRPRLDPLIVLVREAVQNSWDARRDDDTPLHFGIAAHHLDSVQRRLLTTDVFRDPPKAAMRLREVLDRDDVMLLALTDRGATGLAGPIRADRPPRRGEPSNFVDLLFNVGQPADREFGGGTYGFGRTISYVVSEARAIVVHSRTGSGRSRQSRFIAAAFSDHYVESNQRFTGRHWWGSTAADSIEPVVGDEADEIAASLGLPSFAADETGTTICVVAPDLRGRTPEQACRFMAGALTWNFWPKMIAAEAGVPSMNFAVSLDDAPITVPAPQDLPPLDTFGSCLQLVRDAATHGPSAERSSHGATELQLEKIVLPRTGETIGWLALAQMPVRPRPLIDEGEDDEAELGPSAPFVGPSHHVALLRDPELIVEYLDTPELHAATSEYVGVFKPVRTLDRAFAKAEPPTHDGWNANLVPESKLRRFVGVALRTIRAITTDYAGRPVPATDPASAERIAAALDGLFEEDREHSRRPPPRVTIGDVRHLEVGERRISDIPFTVEHAPDGSGTIVQATAHVATHDGWTVERNPGMPTGPANRVDMLGFVDADGTIREGDVIVVMRSDAPAWSVRVHAPSHLSVGVDIVPRRLEEDVE